MSKKSATVQSRETFKDYLKSEYLAVCSDAIVSTDQTISLVRLLDQIAAFAYPVPLTRFVVVSQFWRNNKVSIDQFSKTQLVQRLILVNPQGDVTELGENKAEFNPLNPWTTTRSIFDLSGLLALKQPGIYTLKLLGKVNDGEYEEIIEKYFPAILLTGLPGFYTVQFASNEYINDSEKQGNGFILLSPDGKIQGGDGGYDYHGNYRLKNDQIHADINIRRRDPNAQSIYGNVEQFDLTLEGVLDSNSVEQKSLSLHGHQTENPKEKIEIILTKQTQIPFPT